MWRSEYSKTQTYTLIATLNQIRNHLVRTTDFAMTKMQVLTASDIGIAIQKDKVITVVTNVGSPVRENPLLLDTIY